MVMDRKEGSGLDKVFTLLYALYWVEKKREREREKKKEPEQRIERSDELSNQRNCQLLRTIARISMKGGGSAFVLGRDAPF